jgi:hypothetical protein
MKRGKQAQQGEFFEFFHAVEKANAEVEAEMVRRWTGKAPESWQAAKAFLARRFPERWGDNKSELKALRRSQKA